MQYMYLTFCSFHIGIEIFCVTQLNSTAADALVPSVTMAINNHDINLLWPSEAIWWHKSGSPWAQVMACCQMAPSHYWNQCCLLNSEVLWNSPKSNFTMIAQACVLYNEFDNCTCTFGITATSSRGQGVNSLGPNDAIWWHGTRSTLAQIMACCLTVPSHYMNQCWLIIGEVPWDSS